MAQFQIVRACPNCASSNRVPSGYDLTVMKCGKCEKPMVIPAPKPPMPPKPDRKDPTVQGMSRTQAAKLAVDLAIAWLEAATAAAKRGQWQAAGDLYRLTWDAKPELEAAADLVGLKPALRKAFKDANEAGADF